MNKSNRIIVLIDFSEYSEILTDFALHFSETINAKVILVHQITDIAPSMADLSVREEILRSELEIARSKLQKLTKGLIYSKESFCVSEKPVLTMLRELKSEQYFDWVFVGLKGSGTLKRIFIGSTTLSIIEDSDFMTVALPLSRKIAMPKNIMVGINPIYPINSYQLQRVLSSLKTVKSELEFFTILKENENDEKAQNYLSILNTEFKIYQPTTRIYKGSTAFDGLKKKVELTENSFLILQQGSRTLTDKLFRKFMINELVYNAKTPLIVLSS